MTMTPLAFARDYIFHWEDGQQTDANLTHSMRADDNGNWQGGQKGVGALVGSNHGVTATALAAFRGVRASSITKAIMHALTLDEAAQIALKLYYYMPRFDRLPWDPLMASVMDFGWGSGPAQATKSLQRMIGATPDGSLGPATIAAYSSFVAHHGIKEAASLWGDVRAAFYQRLNQPQFIKGWLNRTTYFEPGGDWWARFNA